MAYLGPYNELKKLYCILLPEIRCSDWNWGKLFMVVIKCECVQKKKKRKKCYWIVNLLFPPLCFIKSLYLTSLKIFNSSPSRRIKWYRFLYITLKVFHSTAPPTILIVVHLKPHRVNCQKHPTTSRLHYFTQAADSLSDTYFQTTNNCKIPSNLYQLKYQFSQNVSDHCHVGIKLVQRYSVP